MPKTSSGFKVVVLSAVAPRVYALVEDLQSLIASDVLPLPFEQIHCLECPSVKSALQEDSRSSAWWLVVSPGAAHCFLEYSAKAPFAVHAVGIGPGTNDVLRMAGLNPLSLFSDDQEAFDAQHLLKRLQALPERARPALLHVICGTKTKIAWTPVLAALGFVHQIHEIYERRTLPVDAIGLSSLDASALAGNMVSWVLPSEHSLSCARAICSDKGFLPERVFCPHPRLVEFAKSLGFRQVKLYEPGIQGLARALQSEGG